MCSFTQQILIKLFLHVRPWYRPQGCSEERTKDPVLVQLTLRWREIRIEPTENYTGSVSLLWRKVEKAQGLGRAGEVVYWVVRDGLTAMVTFEGRPEDVRAGAKGCAGRGENRCPGSGTSIYIGETSERPVPGWRDELQFWEEGRKRRQRVTRALWGQACQHQVLHCRPARG